jgi:hypothetical protein
MAVSATAANASGSNAASQSTAAKLAATSASVPDRSANHSVWLATSASGSVTCSPLVRPLSLKPNVYGTLAVFCFHVAELAAATMASRTPALTSREPKSSHAFCSPYNCWARFSVWPSAGLALLSRADLTPSLRAVGLTCLVNFCAW